MRRRSARARRTGTPLHQRTARLVDAWLAAIGEARGLPPDTALASARLGIAVTRGLLLDLLATGDRAAVDAAMEHWIALNVSQLERLGA